MKRPNDRPSNKAGADEVEVNAEHPNPYTGAVRKHDELCDFDLEEKKPYKPPFNSLGSPSCQRPRRS